MPKARAGATYSNCDLGKKRVCAASGSIAILLMPSDPIIYIVEDDAAVRRSLERLLGAANLTAVSYPTPKAFLAAVPTLDFGCVLLDIRLPGMDGLAVQA